ncbi:MAG: hypothetical protein ABI888_05975 [Chloroflexota bacterium]
MRTSILVLLSVFAAACAPPTVAVFETPAPERAAVAVIAATDGELTLDIAELI